MSFSYSIRRRLTSWLEHRLPACQDIVADISESLDRRLPPHRRLILKLHLLVCARCVRYLRQLLLMRTAVRARAASVSDAEGGEPSLSAEARERVRRALNKIPL
ncbi:MAG TPA: zf-HC2 domain-containing protein [Pyrinomonadaceae bacterium]|nr:zf-HC2 domain-containing protein [Pyrinomonadaceae bacterium]